MDLIFHVYILRAYVHTYVISIKPVTMSQCQHQCRTTKLDAESMAFMPNEPKPYSHKRIERAVLDIAQKLLPTCLNLNYCVCIAVILTLVGVIIFGVNATETPYNNYEFDWCFYLGKFIKIDFVFIFLLF